jgi:hypothetical protein
MYGLTPIFKSLEIDSIAELVCSVVNTACPVSAALILVSAVSDVLVSQTRITSGSCLKIALSPSS